jgi:hypothetical protein
MGWVVTETGAKIPMSRSTTPPPASEMKLIWYLVETVVVEFWGNSGPRKHYPAREREGWQLRSTCKSMRYSSLLLHNALVGALSRGKRGSGGHGKPGAMEIGR